MTKSYTCFFIAPMSTEEDMALFKRIANELLVPILQPLGYTVTTPDNPSGSADIFESVMKSLDVADLLIADLTHDNANVYYELGIRHSLGLPYALISQHKSKFDITTLRYVLYDPNDLHNPTMRADLEAFLNERHQAVVTKNDVTNPITGFYGAPLAEVSPASGLGLGYYRNFINYAMRDIRDERNSVEIDGAIISKEEQQSVRLHIWIPTLLQGAVHDNIDGLLVRPRKLLKARILKPGSNRDFPLYAYPDRSQGVVLIDIPTALNAMEVAINGRYSAVRLDKQSEQWKALEQQEIERFRDTIRRLLGNEESLLIQNNVRLLSWDVLTGEAQESVS